MIHNFSIEKMAETLGLNCKFLYLLSNQTPLFYKIYKIPKKNGKFRTIEAPVPVLKRVQKYLLQYVLPSHVKWSAEQIDEITMIFHEKQKKIPRLTNSMPTATAFEPGCSVKQNASVHCGKPVVISLDIKNFFPSLRYDLVLSLFKRYVSEDQIAVMFSKFCTLYGHLPQGSVASPHISNLIMCDFDANIYKYCVMHDLSYTRYADDLTFSGNPDNGEISELIHLCREELKKLCLRLNNDKIRVQRTGMRQEVTGVVVNSKINAPREARRALRQKMYYLNKHWESEWRNLDEHSLNVLLGKANFIWDLDRNNPEICEYRKQLLEIKRYFNV